MMEVLADMKMEIILQLMNVSNQRVAHIYFSLLNGYIEFN